MKMVELPILWDLGEDEKDHDLLSIDLETIYRFNPSNIGNRTIIASSKCIEGFCIACPYDEFKRFYEDNMGKVTSMIKSGEDILNDLSS